VCACTHLFAEAEQQSEKAVIPEKRNTNAANYTYKKMTSPMNYFKHLRKK
jgi:hypothetical protein